ncbi:hypothetical protein H4S08_002354 [Coemansia sp. RSA 1365]|nr:hypothetical protein H4S08_002354 [Coemansia sp. RSA 1365]
MALYSKQDLKDSQELYQKCEFISKKTRSIYAWRAALWVRYCKEQSLDFAVTENKMIDYLDWLFEIDLVNKINTKKSYVPDILRDHMGSVICLWRIQTGNNPDLVSPKEGTRYQTKWDEILRTYPRRERHQQRSFAHDDLNTEVVPSASGMPVSPRIGTGYPPVYADTPYQHYASRSPRYHHPPHFQHPQHYPAQQQQHPILPATPIAYYPQHPQYPLHQRSQQQQQYPVGISEPIEMTWQLQWLQDLSWSSATARLLFTIAMSTWAETVHVTGLKLGDIYFASSTMAPRLPSSVMRISLVTSPATSPHARPSGATSSLSAGRHLRTLASRRPFILSANALLRSAIARPSCATEPRSMSVVDVGVMLFHHWHVANLQPPTFADGSWQSTPVLPVHVRDAAALTSATASPGRPMDLISSADTEVERFPFGEQLGLVRNLLPTYKLPLERVVRLQSLDRIRQLASPRSGSGSEPGEPRIAQGRRSLMNYDFAPLVDISSPERLEQLLVPNSGYYESHHCIQRHKVIPSDSLQQMIFPWATTMLSTMPGNASIDERRNISRFLDFLLDLRIVLLQDIAILKCCSAYLPPQFTATSILGNSIFSTHEFLQYCEIMQRDAADEIQILQYDLDLVVSYPGNSEVGEPLSGEINNRNRSQYSTGSSTANHGLPPLGLNFPIPPQDSSAMVVGSPDDEAFSPIISPTPPPAGIRDDPTRNATLFMDIPPNSAGSHTKHAPLSAMTQHSMSHSMPNRSRDGWSDGYFDCDSRNAGRLNSAIPVPAEPMPTKTQHTGASATPHTGASVTNIYPSSMHSTMSPRLYWRSTQTQRVVNSPIRLSDSPGERNAGISGGRSGQFTLPSFAQFAQPIRSSAPLGRVGSPTSGKVSPESLHKHQDTNSNLRELDPNALPGVPRRSSDSTEDGIGGGMATGRDEPSSGDSDQLRLLRRENASLKERMQKLELTVAEKQEQIQSWMSRMEKQIMRNGEQPM